MSVNLSDKETDFFRSLSDEEMTLNTNFATHEVRKALTEHFNVRQLDVVSRFVQEDEHNG